ncbi:MAG: hypothetical protein ACQEXN_02500 [Actinomycetota bacterium]
MSDGTKLSGSYGTWRGEEIELDSTRPLRGKLVLIQDGGDRPGPEWGQQHFPNRFARTPIHFRRIVDANEVSDLHSIRATAKLDRLSVELLAEDDEGRLAVHTLGGAAPNHMDRFVQEFGFERYENAFVFGWVPRHALADITIERTAREK